MVPAGIVNMSIVESHDLPNRAFWYSLQGVLSIAAEQVSECLLILSMSEVICVSLGFSDGNTRHFFQHIFPKETVYMFL